MAKRHDKIVKCSRDKSNPESALEKFARLVFIASVKNQYKNDFSNGGKIKQIISTLILFISFKKFQCTCF